MIGIWGNFLSFITPSVLEFELQSPMNPLTVIYSIDPQKGKEGYGITNLSILAERMVLCSSMVELGERQTQHHTRCAFSALNDHKFPIVNSVN